MGGALRGSLWTAVIWTAPETRTQGLPLAPQPPNPLNLCPTLMTGKVHLHICSMVNLCLFLPDFSVVVVCYFHIHRCFYLFFFVIYDKLQWPGSNPPYDAELMFFLLCFLQRQPSEAAFCWGLSSTQCGTSCSRPGHVHPCHWRKWVIFVVSITLTHLSMKENGHGHEFCIPSDMD